MSIKINRIEGKVEVDRDSLQLGKVYARQDGSVFIIAGDDNDYLRAIRITDKNEIKVFNAKEITASMKYYEVDMTITIHK